MKKIFVAVALVMGLGTTVAFAENLTSGVETVMAVNDFTPIEVKDAAIFGPKNSYYKFGSFIGELYFCFLKP